RLMPGERVVSRRVVTARTMVDGADEGKTVEDPGQTRQVFAETNPRRGGRDDGERATNPGGGRRFWIEGIEMARPAELVQQDAGTRPGAALRPARRGVCLQEP